MNTIQKMAFVILVTFLLSVLMDRGFVIGYNYYQTSKGSDKELSYYKQASKINDLLFSIGTPVRDEMIVNILKNIDKQVASYYPNGPFTRNDFIALAWTESEFRQYEHGTHGERGVFQIMPCEFKEFYIHKNYYDPDVNTEMCFRVLNGKYMKFKDYKVAIMAYNGLIKMSNGKYSQKYWNSFYKRKLAIDLALNK